VKQNKLRRRLERRSTAIMMPTSADAGRCFLEASGREVVELEDESLPVLAALLREAMEAEVGLEVIVLVTSLESTGEDVDRTAVSLLLIKEYQDFAASNSLMPLT
jgi:hypothetical protein